MITKNPGLYIDTYFGISSDNPPITPNIKNGSIFYVMDTKKVYMFDRKNQVWIEQ